VFYANYEQRNMQKLNFKEVGHFRLTHLFVSVGSTVNFSQAKFSSTPLKVKHEDVVIHANRNREIRLEDTRMLFILISLKEVQKAADPTAAESSEFI